MIKEHLILIRDHHTQKCEYFRCDTNQTNCWNTFDNYRHCDEYGGGCICDSLYSEDVSNGNKCKYDPGLNPYDKITTPPSSNSYYWYGAIPLGFFLFLCAIFRRMGNICYRFKKNQPRKISKLFLHFTSYFTLFSFNIRN